MCTAVQSVKGIACNFDSIFMCNGRQMQQAVRAAGNGCMHQNRIFEAFHCNQIMRTDPCHCKFYTALSCTVCVFRQIRTFRRKKCTAGKRQPKCLCHDLHGARCPDKAACAATRAGILLGPGKFLLRYFSSFIFCTVHTKLFECQKIRTCIHCAACYHN